MTERPILFNAEMVKAILEGRKTQTRRVIKPKSKALHDNNVACIVHRESGDKWYQDHVFSMRGKHGVWEDYTLEGFLALCPFGQVGDRLWVRETFRLFDSDECPHSDFPCGCPSWGTPLYRASHDCLDGEKWTPSIHMPRSASRILLEITNVRVERLQSISNEDAKAEGFDYSTHPSAIEMGYAIGARTNFRHTWEEIYGANAWNKNPWVWVVEFVKLNEVTA